MTFPADLDTYKLTMQSVADEVTASAKREKLTAASLESLTADMQLLRSQLEDSQREVAESRSACHDLQRQIADKEASDLNEQASHQKSSEAVQSQLRLTLEQLEMVRAERKTLRIELDSLQSAMQVSSAQAVKVQGEADSARAESRRREKELADASAQVCMYRVLMLFPGGGFRFHANVSALISVVRAAARSRPR